MTSLITWLNPENEIDRMVIKDIQEINVDVKGDLNRPKEWSNQTLEDIGISCMSQNISIIKENNYIYLKCKVDVDSPLQEIKPPEMPKVPEGEDAFDFIFKWVKNENERLSGIKSIWRIFLAWHPNITNFKLWQKIWNEKKTREQKIKMGESIN